MTHTVVYNPGVGIIETTVQGTLTLSEAKEIILEIANWEKRRIVTYASAIIVKLPLTCQLFRSMIYRKC
jgi:hypothetical protein